MLNIISPRNSFIRFGEPNTVESCNFESYSQCLPVYSDNDVAFQFVLQAETEEEADNLCDLANELITLGICEDCDGGMLINFQDAGYRPQRYRISPRQVLYNWDHGLPGFATVISVAQCFVVKVDINGQEFCTNCFQRIGNDCHTSVIEYGNEDNAYGFNYCSDVAVDSDSDQACEPLIVSFANKSTLAIPYTAQLVDQYGSIPNVQVWIYDDQGDLVDMGISVIMDAFPPTLLSFDFGGNASGVIKIS